MGINKFLSLDNRYVSFTKSTFFVNKNSMVYFLSLEIVDVKTSHQYHQLNLNLDLTLLMKTYLT